jgi:hypothetical protein
LQILGGFGISRVMQRRSGAAAAAKILGTYLAADRHFR